MDYEKIKFSFDPDWSSGKILQAAMEAISTSGEWAVVPVEPTREMWAASGDAQVKHAGMFSLHHDAVTRMVWDAMLSAARPKVA